LTCRLPRLSVGWQVTVSGQMILAGRFEQRERGFKADYYQQKIAKEVKKTDDPPNQAPAFLRYLRFLLFNNSSRPEDQPARNQAWARPAPSFKKPVLASLGQREKRIKDYLPRPLRLTSIPTPPNPRIAIEAGSGTTMPQSAPPVGYDPNNNVSVRRTESHM